MLFYKKCIEAFKKQDFIVLISAGYVVDIDKLSYAPDNFIIEQSFPQQQLLDYVDLFITHSGMNSVNEALFHGVPMILLPHHIEQKMVAKSVCELEAEILLDIKKITPDKLCQAANQLLIDSKYKRNAIK